MSEPASEFDPGSMPVSSFSTDRAVWYRRPWVIAAVAIAVVVAVSVVTDLPHPISRAQDAADQNASLSEINADLRACAYAVTEDFGFYRQDVAGTLTKADRSVAVSYLPSDEVVCSFAGDEVYDLTNNLQITLTTAGKQIQDVEARTLTWITSDANGAIKDIIGLFAHSGDGALLKDLSAREDRMAQDRQAALSALARASADLGVTLHHLNMPALGRLPGTG